MTQSFDIDKYNSRECEVHNHAFYLGAQSKQAEIDELRKRIDDALKAMDGESANSWGLWKEKGDMYEQGASNAYEKSYWILKGTTNEQ